jgi:hypothetical protein
MPRIVSARPADTTADAERVQIGLLQAASVPRRLHLALSLTATVIGAARRALERTHPDLSARELDLLFVNVHYGRDLADAVRRDLERRDRPRTHDA